MPARTDEHIRAKCFHPSGTFVEFPKEDVESSIPERFQKIAKRYPSRIGLDTGTETIAYGGLNTASNRLAHTLVGECGSKQEPVVLFYERDISFVIAYMAVLKAGKFAIHLAPSSDKRRITHILKDSNARIVLTTQRLKPLANQFVSGDRRVLVGGALSNDVDIGDLNLPIKPDDIAYIRYTSGSTANAKGAVRTHSHILNAASDLTNSFHICPEDRVAVFGRDYGGKNLFVTLLNGATQYPLNLGDDGTFNLFDWLTENQITILISLPTVFRSLLLKSRTKPVCPTLRLICVGSEPLYKNDVDSYKRLFSDNCIFLYTYGSSETGIICENFIDKNTEITGNRVPVGYSPDGVEVLVLDSLNNKALVNKPGEIVVRSRHLSSGYWQNGGVVRDKFQSNSRDPQKRTYRSGDIGQILPNGSLEHLGRKDSMVKIRGLSADLAEIEAVLANQPQVLETVVLAKDKSSNDKVIVAYYVEKAGAPTTVSELRNFLAAKLPRHMIPADFVRLEKFPLTATGKINRRELPDPSASRPHLVRQYVEGRTPIEKELSRIWSEVLGLDKVGIHDNFFELGGHSLTATQIISRVIVRFQLEIPLQSLLRSPTIANMAEVIAAHQGKMLSEQELKNILDDLESLSEEDAKNLVGDLQSGESKH